MEATNDSGINLNKASLKKENVTLTLDDKLNLGHMKYAQGSGASLRYANELAAVQKVGRLPFLKSSHLHEDVLRGNLGPGTGFLDMLGEDEEKAPSRLAFLWTCTLFVGLDDFWLIRLVIVNPDWQLRGLHSKVATINLRIKCARR